MNKKLLFPALALGLAACSINTPPDMTAVHYKGGMVESKSFAGCVSPSTREYNNGGDTYYMYPASQRYYQMGGDNADSNAITFVTADGIEMTVTGVVNFDLETDCETLRTFHERIGNRTQAYFDDGGNSAGWLNMLDVYVGGPINTAIDRAGQDYTYKELYNDPKIKAEWEKRVIELLPGLVDRQTDGDETFFKNFAVTLQKPEPPQAIKDALVAQQSKVADAAAKKAEADAQVATAKAQKALEEAEAAKAQIWIDTLGPDGYLKKLVIESGQNPYQPASALVTDK